MAVIKEWCCIEHGDFEGSHPICPQLGCDSAEVTRVFRTAPSISKGKFKRFEASTRRTAEMMGIRDFNSQRSGDVSFAGRGEDAPEGMGVLWGDGAVQKAMGRSFSQLTQLAAKPLTVPTKDGPRTLTRNNALADLATDSGITRRVTPRAGEVVSADKNEAAKAKNLTA